MALQVIGVSTEWGSGSTRFINVRNKTSGKEQIYGN